MGFMDTMATRDYIRQFPVDIPLFADSLQYKTIFLKTQQRFMHCLASYIWDVS